jgi:hypothetical protein
VKCILSAGLWRSIAGFVPEKILSRAGIVSWIAFAACFLLSPAPAGAQAVGVGTNSAAPGTAVDLPISLTPGARGIATLQCDLTLPSALTPVRTLTGAAAAAAGKSASMSASSAGMRVLMFGLNQNPLGSGELAVVRLNIAAGTPASSLAVAIGNIVASDALGNNVAAGSSGGSVVVTTLNDTTTPTISNDTAPPAISFVSASWINQTGAMISWTTNEGADSQVEYGATTAYGKSTVLNPIQLSSHAQTLSGLAPGSLYHYRVRSSDSAGNLAVSGDYTFTASAGRASVLYYPRMLTSSGVESGSTDQEFTGIGIANLNYQTAILRFSAFSPDGSMISGPGIINPATRQLKHGEQLPIMDQQLFGTSVSGPDATGWVRIESDANSVTGFFMMFNGSLSGLDGTDMYSSPLISFLFPEINTDGFTKISIGNPNDAAASLSLSLFRADGTLRVTATRMIPGNGALAADLYADIFPGSTPDPTDYVQAASDRVVLPYQLMGKPGWAGLPASDFQSLRGQDAGAGSSTLYCPQYIVGEIWGTTVSLVNLDGVPGTVSVRFIGDDGDQIGASRILPIDALGKIRIVDPKFFEPSIPSGGRQGYLKIATNGVRLAGSVVFGDITRQMHSTALPLVGNLDQSVVFSHVSSNDKYYTGVAIVNPNSIEAHVIVQLLAGDGNPGIATMVTIPAGRRISTVLTELFPDLVGIQRYSGYFQVTSDVGIASFSVFGSNDLKLLSAIPPQPVR